MPYYTNALKKKRKETVLQQLLDKNLIEHQYIL